MISRLALAIALSVFTLSCDNADFTQKGTGPGDQGKSDKLECNGVMIDTVIVSDFTVQDTDAGEIWTKTRARASMTPYSGELSPSENYGYADLKANIQVGEVPTDQTATHFTYVYQGKLYLYLVFQNLEETDDTTNIKVKVTVKSNQLSDRVVVSDEAYEMGRDVDTFLQETYYLAEFQFQQFTDGVVIGPLNGQDWQAKVEYLNVTPGTVENFDFSDKLVTTTKFTRGQLDTFLLSPARVQGCELPN